MDENREIIAGWTAPPKGWIKANWDANLDVQKDQTGLGVVLRDHIGKLIAGQSQTKEGAPEPSSAEALGAYGAVYFCKELG